jgi:hypothetical protein
VAVTRVTGPGPSRRASTTSTPDGRSLAFTSLQARPIFTPDWYARREVAFGPAVAWAEVEPAAGADWVVWDVTDTVADW